jgi:hypothetical protein
MVNRIKVLLVALMLPAALTLAHPKTEGVHAAAGSPETVTLVGQIIDPTCLIGHGSSGPGHVGCATACAKAGINMGFYNEADQQIYMIFPSGHEDPNKVVIDHLEKRVEIQAVVHKLAGYQGVEIKTIKELGEGKELSLK